MVKNNKDADIKFAEKYNKDIDPIESKIPNNNAWFFVTWPVGIGLKHVLVINASKSDSYHIFKVPAAPAPNATANKDKTEFI